MKVLILGSGGLLGKYLAETFKREFKVFAPSHSDLNIVNYERFYLFVKENKIDVCINCAGITNIYYCEKNPEESLKINAYAPSELAKISKELNIKFVHLSTGFVFNGEKGEEYVESDSPEPKTVYGFSKFKGEILILENNPDALIVRTDEIFGYGNFTPGHNVIGFTIKKILDGKDVSLYNILTSPTYAFDLSLKIEELLKKDKTVSGILHLVNVGMVSYIEVAKIIKDYLKKDVKINIRNDDLIEKIPKNCALKSMRLKDLGIKDMPPFEDALKRCIKKFL
ncbi:MAG: NAD(P)-dependent oxidoreductase [candidate division WOR-3 bacterium]